jgi:hypothetical protein
MAPWRLVNQAATSARQESHRRGRAVSADMHAIDEAPGEGLDEESRFVRGLLFGIGFSLPIWGAIIALARLIA